MVESPDNELVRQARAGDYAAFEALVTRHERGLYAAAWQLTHNHHDAQDVVQNAFVSALENLGTFRGESSFATWVTRIAVNHALKVLRGRRTKGALSLEAPDDDGQAVPIPQYIADWRDDPARVVERGELRTILDQAVAALNEGQRLVFILRDVQGLSVRETAQVLGISESNVKVRLLRARLALRETLTRRFGDPGRRQQPHEHDHEALNRRLQAMARTGSGTGDMGAEDEP